MDCGWHIVWSQKDRHKVSIVVVFCGWEWRVTTNGCEVTFGGDENAPQLDCEDGHTTL